MKKRHIILRMLKLVSPLLPQMLLAITFGVIGFLCAIGIPVLACYGVINIFVENELPSWILYALVACAILRGLLHYAEQYFNHLIAFKILALLRHIVFEKMSLLAPARLEERDKGDLLAILLSDIELLEVFYAHTISPVAIAFVVSLVIIIFIGFIYWPAIFLTIFAFLFVGVGAPLFEARRCINLTNKVRDNFVELNDFMLDNINGIDEIVQFDCGTKRLNQLKDKTNTGLTNQKHLSLIVGLNNYITDACVWLSSLFMWLFLFIVYYYQKIDLSQMILIGITLMSSFGPVLALANLANTLPTTFKSANRVLRLLDEEPLIKEDNSHPDFEFSNAEIDNISFKYNNDNSFVLKDCSAVFENNNITGLCGQSGSGKSTILKLLMRFWDSNKGQILLSEKNITDINTNDLRKNEIYMTQETYIFDDTIFNNISLNREVSEGEVYEACRKANFHEEILNFSAGYQTRIGGQNNLLSGGEKQRIGLARAFLHNANLILLDEPTSNLDALNEATIFSAIKNNKENKAIILVSHRASTLSICDQIYQMDKINNI